MPSYPKPLKLASILALLLASVMTTNPASASTYMYRVAAVGVQAPNPFPIWNVTGSQVLAFTSAYVGSYATPDVAISVKNTGNVAGTLEALVFAGANPEDFSASNNCTNIAPGGSCLATVRFLPSSAGARTADALVGVTSLSFSGTGVALPSGEAVFTTVGTSSWVVPPGVTSLSLVAVGGGGGGSSGGHGGSGGGLTYRNSTAVTPGQILQVTVGAPGTYSTANGGASSVTIGGLVVSAGGGGTTNRIGGCGTGGTSYCGGAGGAQNAGVANYGAGGGGAAGYSSNGGAGGQARADGNTTLANGQSSASGGGGGEGTCGYGTNSGNGWGGGGGGVGLYGLGAGGAGGLAVCTYSQYTAKNPGKGGSGGANGASYAPGAYGGGSAGGAGGGAQGAVRIIWGQGRSFPSSAI